MPPSKRDDQPIVIVNINKYSDGDSTHRPTGPQYRHFGPDEGYMEKLATLWIENRGEKKGQLRYSLDRLPAGYSVYGRPRKTNPSHIDKWLYGHPGHKWFDSPNRFFPHFLHLMENGTNAGCPCTVCASTKSHHGRPGAGSALSSPSTASPNRPGGANVTFKPKGRPSLAESGKVDEEGNPDVYRHLIDQLKRHGSLDALVTEPMSMDWRAEKALLRNSVKLISHQPSWAPRVGELVIFVRKLGEDEAIIYNPHTQLYKVLNKKKLNPKEKGRNPEWEAGVITQTAEEQPTITDLTSGEDSGKKYALNYSGYRVEPLPDPNDKDKSVSKRHAWVPLSQIRPFAFFNEYLKGVSGLEWHPTIGNGIMVMSTVSIVDKYRFKGSWPAAEIFCRGIYIGSELIVVGDLVRLIPHGNELKKEVTDMMKITSIKYVLTSLDKASDNDNDEGRPYNSGIHIVGKAYTSDINRAYVSPETSQAAELTDPPESIRQYSTWYHKQDPSKFTVLPFTQLLSRHLDHNALSIWFPDQELLSKSLEGVIQGRAFSSSNLKHIPEGKTWFWADHRIEALDLKTMNGVDVAAHDESRDPKRWRKEIRILEGTAEEEDLSAVRQRAGLEKGLRRGSLLGSGMVRSAIGNLESDVEALGSRVDSGSVSRKRSRSVISLDNEGDNGEEIPAESADVAMADAGEMSKALPLSDEEVDDEDRVALLEMFGSK